MAEEKNSKKISGKELIAIAATVFTALFMLARSGSRPIQANAKSDSDSTEESDKPDQCTPETPPPVSIPEANLLPNDPHKKSHHECTPQVDWWSRGIGIGTLLAAAVAACIYGGQLTTMQGQLKEMRQENRAWIAPTAGGGTQPPAPQDFKFSVAFGNSGREPATDARYAIKSIGAPTLSQDVIKAVSDFDLSCRSGKEQMTELGASYPSNSSIYALNATFPRDTIDKNKTTVIVGCFLYTTQQETHHTTFCFYWSADKGLINTWFFCPFGNNDAN